MKLILKKHHNQFYTPKYHNTIVNKYYYDYLYTVNKINKTITVYI